MPSLSFLFLTSSSSSLALKDSSSASSLALLLALASSYSCLNMIFSISFFCLFSMVWWSRSSLSLCSSSFLSFLSFCFSNSTDLLLLTSFSIISCSICFSYLALSSIFFWFVSSSKICFFLASKSSPNFCLRLFNRAYFSFLCSMLMSFTD